MHFLGNYILKHFFGINKIPEPYPDIRIYALERAPEWVNEL